MNAAEMRRRMLAGEVMVGLGVRLARSTEIAHVAKEAGYDWLFVDMEHSAIGIDLATQICVAAYACGIVPFVRIPGHEPTVASRLLDNGAVGIIVPHVDAPDDILPVVRQCKFAPLGSRSFGGSLPQLGYAGLAMDEHMAKANEHALIVPMVESPKSVANAAAIAAIPGVDGLTFGTNDLTIEMGIPGELGHPRVEEAYRSVLAAAKPAGKFVGIGGIRDPKLLERYLPLGFSMVMTASDLGLVTAGAKDNLALLRGLTGR